MTTNKNASKAADLVKQFKLDPNMFPDLLERLHKNCLRHYANTDDWMKVEEKFYAHKQLLGYYVEDLIYKQQYDLGLSICKRHKLYENGDITKQDTLEVLKPYYEDPPAKTFTYIENDLFTKDAFAPTEEAIGQADPGTYWHLEELGYEWEKNVFWIDDENSEMFDKAVADLLSSNVVGLDSEFKFAMTKFERTGVSVLQIANRNAIYLLDVLKLGDSEKYDKFMISLFQDSKILKVLVIENLNNC